MKMKKIGAVLIVVVLMVLSNSCGINGDPGHCYFSVDWEYYDDEYGVMYYEDDNPDVPQGINLEANVWYDCYPGTYSYYYESEDYEYLYTYEGTYTLIQELGTAARLFDDGMDGLDTELELYLYVYARKAVNADVMKTASIDAETSDGKQLSDLSPDHTTLVPLRVETSTWEQEKDGWKMIVNQTVKVYPKK